MWAMVQVAQLSGYVSEHSAYHHGEQSLQTTIVGMAQNFVGSNNINLLVPQGAPVLPVVQSTVAGIALLQTVMRWCAHAAKHQCAASLSKSHSARSLSYRIFLCPPYCRWAVLLCDLGMHASSLAMRFLRSCFAQTSRPPHLLLTSLWFCCTGQRSMLLQGGERLLRCPSF